MKKIFLSIAALALLASCNEKRDVTPDYLTTDVTTEFTLPSVSVDAPTDGMQACGAVIKRNVPNYVKGLTVIAKCTGKTNKKFDFTFDAITKQAKSENITLSGLYLGSNDFTFSTFSTVEAGLTATNLTLKDADAIVKFKKEPIFAKCESSITKLIKSSTNSFDAGELPIVSSPAKVLINNHSALNFKVAFQYADDVKKVSPFVGLEGNTKGFKGISYSLNMPLTDMFEIFENMTKKDTGFGYKMNIYYGEKIIASKYLILEKGVCKVFTYNINVKNTTDVKNNISIPVLEITEVDPEDIDITMQF